MKLPSGTTALTYRRKEFSKAVKREALLRSGGLCEAVGPLYGLEPGQRCNVNLAYGVHFDHVNADSNGGEPTLENCAAVCPQCNMFKAHKHDTPRAAKVKRQYDKHNGIVRPKGKIPSRQFNQPRFDNTRYVERDYDT